ncbi:hypothetical protein SAY87_028406 [Trapa incisa]|uniref:Transcription elongation factor n=1 Tax=Trapa incisa TaxID=236973 RepID=A0AAN7QP55_9MYRT|nr:hypothetical protein SAY87_028406 [Trapa incisa]
MEEELVQLFQAASKAADAAAAQVGRNGDEENRCLDALKHLKSFPVTSQVLVSTQVGRMIRRFTKHPKKKIQDYASDVIQIWKNIVTNESNGCKRKETENGVSCGKVSQGKNNNAKDSLVRAEEVSMTPLSKARKLLENGTPGSYMVEKMTLQDKSYHTTSKSQPNPGLEKSTFLVRCNDPMRDKVRELLYEALSKVSSEAEQDMTEEMNACDPSRVAVSVESVMFEEWGKMNGAQKVKYRSILFNIKDQNNPDFRRKVLLGQIKPERLLSMTTQEMASDHRQRENQRIQEKAMLDCEIGGAPKATTNQFKCGRCGQRKCSYYQMQTRSADEPMTTYVTCVKCNHRWKFC